MAAERFRSQSTQSLTIIHQWRKNPKYRREYEALEEEFSLSAEMMLATELRFAPPR